MSKIGVIERYRNFLPVTDKTPVISLCEGDTPLIRAEKLEENSKEISVILNTLIGLELIEQNPTKIVAKVLLDSKEISLSALIRRIDVILRSMIDDVDKNESDYENIRERDKEVNKLTFLVKRVIKAAIIDSELAKTLTVTTKLISYASSSISNV